MTKQSVGASSNRRSTTLEVAGAVGYDVELQEMSGPWRSTLMPGGGK